MKNFARNVEVLQQRMHPLKWLFQDNLHSCTAGISKNKPFFDISSLGQANYFASAPASSETCRLNCHYRLTSNDTPTLMNNGNFNDKRSWGGL